MPERLQPRHKAIEAVLPALREGEGRLAHSLRWAKQVHVVWRAHVQHPELRDRRGHAGRKDGQALQDGEPALTHLERVCSRARERVPTEIERLEPPRGRDGARVAARVLLRRAGGPEPRGDSPGCWVPLEVVVRKVGRNDLGHLLQRCDEGVDAAIPDGLVGEGDDPHARQKRHGQGPRAHPKGPEEPLSGPELTQNPFGKLEQLGVRLLPRRLGGQGAAESHLECLGCIWEGDGPKRRRNR